MAGVAVAGSIAQRPGHGGHAWVFLNYLLGLRALGHRVTFIDRLEAEMLAAGHVGGIDTSVEARWLDTVMREAGLGADYVLVTDDPRTRSAAAVRLADADLLINVNGFLSDRELLAAAAVTAFWDIDPGILQIWEKLGLASIFAGHDLYFTVGENIGEADCEIPTCGIDWIPTKQPVALKHWPDRSGVGVAFTTLATWRGPYAPLEYEGRTYGMRAHEFRRFFDLPRRVAGEFRLALDIEPSDHRDITALREGTWELVAPASVAATPDMYREFIQTSQAEVAIAKQLYVGTRSGWFSDRSACYLASGKPVIGVDTAFSRNLPTGEGLFAVDDVASAAAACEELAADPQRHQRAARAIAVEHFDSDKVWRRVLDLAGI